MLTDTKLKNLKPAEKIYKVSDRDGLYVAVLPSGTVSFRYNYTISCSVMTILEDRFMSTYSRHRISPSYPESEAGMKNEWRLTIEERTDMLMCTIRQESAIGLNRSAVGALRIKVGG